MSSASGPELAVVWDRTSGDEHEEQDAKAQVAATAHRAALAGFAVLGVEHDEDVPGDTPWSERPGMTRGLRMARERGAVFVTRSPSRLWRGRPAEGLILAEGVPNLELLGKPHWSRRNGAWLQDEDGDEVLRFIDLWQAWVGKRGIKQETQHAMDELKAGRRETRSGKPHHRPPRELIPEGLAAACGAREGGASQLDTLEAYREASGYYQVTDPDARRRRDVSRTVLMERVRLVLEMGVPIARAAADGKAPAAGKVGLPERGAAVAAAAPGSMGPHPDSAGADH